MVILATIRGRPGRVVAFATTRSVVVIAKKVIPRNRLVVVGEAPLVVMGDTEAVHLVPRLLIRGRDIGAGGANDAADLEKTMRNAMRVPSLFPKKRPSVSPKLRARTFLFIGRLEFL